MKYETVMNAWIKAGTELGIRVEAPYEIRINNEKSCQYIAYLPDFGNKKGTLILAATSPEFNWDEEAVSIAKEKGFYFSILNAEEYSDFKKNHFQETLDDWGYFGAPELKPNWYTGKYWGQTDSEQKARPDEC